MFDLSVLLRIVRLNLLLLFAAISVAAAGPRVSIKGDEDLGFVYAGQHGYAKQQPLLYAASGAQRVFSYAIVSHVGGVILQGIAEPETAVAKLAVSYDRAAGDGQRFKVILGTETGDIRAPDWQIIPLIKFVDSKQTAAVSLLGEPKNEAEKREVNDSMFVEIHPAFRDTVLGNNFVFTDAMLVGSNPNQLRAVTERFSEPISGYSDLAPFEEARSAAAARRLQLALQNGGWNSYIFTDVDVRFTFGIRDKKLEISGEPYYAFVQADELKETSKVNAELTNTFRNDPVFQDLNPKIYALNRSTFRITAFLRSVRASNAEGWKALVKEVSGKTPEPTMETPRAWIPD
ncbi:hypothetical protein V1286_002007 [Bradyrhizobium algeriense]|uniref:Uncharacterized protein n=1 Tax=Bradyrhizobium algeriense TaxID=634784 RepID=A0ABU8B7F4_9BRAD